MNDHSADQAKSLRKLGSLRTLWPFVQRQRGLFGAWLLALAVSSSATLSLPMAVRQMIDHGFSDGGRIKAVEASTRPTMMPPAKAPNTEPKPPSATVT